MDDITSDCGVLQPLPGADGEHGGVARRGAEAHTASAGDDAQTGLSIGHIRPLSFNSVSLSRNDGGYVWLGPGRSEYYPDSLVTLDCRPGEVQWTPDGSLIKVRQPPGYRVKSSLKAKPSLRGSVSGFSPKSRCRLLQTLARTVRAMLPVFVTLTYPGEWPRDPKVWKADLAKFRRRLLRRFPLIGAIWKLEPQKRAAPHYHMLVWMPGLSPFEVCTLLRAWVPSAWYECVASGDKRHLRAGTRVEEIRSFRGLMFYASKYLGKPVEVESDAWGRPGRFWGVIGRTNVPWAQSLSVWLDKGQWSALFRWLRRFRRLKGRDLPSLWAVVESPDTWLTNLERFGTC